MVELLVVCTHPVSGWPSRWAGLLMTLITAIETRGTSSLLSYGRSAGTRVFESLSSTCPLKKLPPTLWKATTLQAPSHVSHCLFGPG